MKRTLVTHENQYLVWIYQSKSVDILDAVHSLNLLLFMMIFLRCTNPPIFLGRTGILLSDKSNVRRFFVSLSKSSGN